MKFYAAIDLKSFYSSVECQERGLDPLTTNLVVADPTRTDKTICLAFHLPCAKNTDYPVARDFLKSTPKLVSMVSILSSLHPACPTISNIVKKYIAPISIL